MKYLSLFLIFFIFNLNATLCNWPSPNDKLVFKLTSTYQSNSTQFVFGTSPTKAQYVGCSPYVGASTTDYTLNHSTVNANGSYNYYFSYVQKSYSVATTCPTGEIPDSKNICKPFSPCSWATNPPWHPLNESGYNSVSCTPLNANSLFANHTPNYVSDASWCSSNSTCYVRSAGCPVGQFYDKSKHKCVYPIGDENKCHDGYVTRNWSTSIDGITKTCWTEKICKSNPAIKETYKVSCGTSADDKAPATGSEGTKSPSIAPDSSRKPTSGTSGNCFASQSVARMECSPPNVLAFSCDPTTGIVTKSTCTLPTTPTTTQINEGDSTKGATTEDLKNLSNTLPTAIKDALSDYFTDGSYSHLESIRGSLEANTILHADTNDKLDSISASTDASLVLQGDANEKLDSIKDSTDGVKDALTAGGSYFGDSMPSESDLSPDADTASNFDVFTNSITSVQDTFNNAQNVFSGGLHAPTFSGGSCPTYNFYSHPVSLNKIGDAISPYSSIFAILIYISSIIASFRLVINFLSRGV